MGRGTSTLILLAILAALAGVYFYSESHPPAETEVKDKAFTNVKADDIEEVRITLADGDASRLQKGDGRWQLVDPVKADADASELSSITSGLATLDIQRVVDENASDLKRYGLEPARIEVGFRAKGDKDVRRLLLGEKTPTGSELYAALPGQKKVFLVNSFVESTFNKNTFALREKTILKFDREKAETLELTDAGSGLQFTRKGTDWSVTKPIAVRGDYGAIEGAVERLGSAQMQGVVEQDGTDLAKYGLDKPTATIAVVSGSSRATLILGKTDNALVFAKDLSRPMIFTVAPTIRTDLFKDVSEYRRKDLFDARSFTANRFEFRRGAETLTFTKTKTSDGKETWKNAAGKDVDAMKMEDLLSKVTGLRASAFEAGTNASLNAPTLTVVATFDDKKMETVTFGRAGTDVFARRADEPGSAKVEALPVDEAMKALDAVK
jgi:hypothetical protein